MYIDLFGSLPLVVIWLALGAVGIVIQAFVRGQSKLVFGYYNATLIMTGVLAAVTHSHEGTSFNGMITLGGMASYFDMLFCGAGVLTMWGLVGICRAWTRTRRILYHACIGSGRYDVHGSCSEPPRALRWHRVDVDLFLHHGWFPSHRYSQR